MAKVQTSDNAQGGYQEFALTKFSLGYGEALSVFIGTGDIEISHPVAAPIKSTQSAYVKVTVTNSGVGTATFSLDKVSNNFHLVEAYYLGVKRKGL
ncbi:MAG TPA: hypothetical protein PL182_05435 [Pseudobdellovibrionaceae bacterium]|nr:hypothetical protein [Pseudobdellovibrionaceae bacterium]